MKTVTHQLHEEVLTSALSDLIWEEEMLVPCLARCFSHLDKASRGEAAAVQTITAALQQLRNELKRKAKEKL